MHVVRLQRLLLGAATLAVSSCSCIARGTRIRTPRGERPIEELSVGDAVICVAPDTGALVSATLSATRMATRECIALGFGEGELIATSDHPLYCPTTREWAPAGDWVLGKRTHLLGAGGEEVAPIAVARSTIFAGVRDVFDLSVEHRLHNFVANGVLVHNKKYAPMCTAETVTLRAETSCGAAADLIVTSRTGCALDVAGGTGSGLPSTGHTSSRILAGFSLTDFGDGGTVTLNCNATPKDGGVLSIACTSGCSGTLTPR